MFVDQKTSGSWYGLYGKQGWIIPNLRGSYPADVVATASGLSTWTWANPSTDPAAPQNPAGATRIAAAYYNSKALSFRLAFSDSQTRRVSVYCLDYDAADRIQIVEVLDSDTGALLDIRTIGNFSEGVYLSFDVRGRVTIRARPVMGGSAVISGLFFD